MTTCRVLYKSGTEEGEQTFAKIEDAWRLYKLLTDLNYPYVELEVIYHGNAMEEM